MPSKSSPERPPNKFGAFLAAVGGEAAHLRFTTSSGVELRAVGSLNGMLLVPVPLTTEAEWEALSLGVLEYQRGLTA